MLFSFSFQSNLWLWFSGLSRSRSLWNRVTFTKIHRKNNTSIKLFGFCDAPQVSHAKWEAAFERGMLSTSHAMSTFQKSRPSHAVTLTSTCTKIVSWRKGWQRKNWEGGFWRLSREFATILSRGTVALLLIRILLFSEEGYPIRCLAMGHLFIYFDNKELFLWRVHTSTSTRPSSTESDNQTASEL